MSYRYFLFLFVFPASLSFADCRVEDVLNQIRPGAQWRLSGGDAATLTWTSTDSVKPSLSEIQTGLTNCQNQINIQQRNNAINDLSTLTDDRAKLQRAVLLTILDQINTLRTQLGLSTITAAQAKAAVQNKINSGASD